MQEGIRLDGTVGGRIGVVVVFHGGMDLDGHVLNSQEVRAFQVDVSWV